MRFDSLRERTGDGSPMEEPLSQSPLRAIMPIDSLDEISSEGREIVVVGEVPVALWVEGKEEAQKTKRDIESLAESCLAKFSKFMGLPMKGFEEEILDLMKRIKGKRLKGTGKGGLVITKFDREIKKLE